MIGLTETWITKTRPFTDKLPGYTFICNDSQHSHGGVGFFILNCHIHKVLTNSNLNLHDCEDLWIKLILPSKRTLVLETVYRYPSQNTSNFEEIFIETIEKLNQKQHSYVVGGDFNINVLKKNSCNYINKLLTLGCSQEVSVATRFPPDYACGTLLDHTYTNILNDKVTKKLLLLTFLIIIQC